MKLKPLSAALEVMYFWRIEKLKGEMAARALSEREALPYLVVWVGSWSAVSYSAQPIENFWDGLEAVWSITLAIIATIYIYKKNGGASGEHFLQRYFALGWVAGIRCVLVVLLAGMAIHLVVGRFGIETEDLPWYEFAFGAASEVLIYWRIGHHVGDLAARAKSFDP